MDKLILELPKILMTNFVSGGDNDSDNNSNYKERKAEVATPDYKDPDVVMDGGVKKKAW